MDRSLGCLRRACELPAARLRPGPRPAAGQYFGSLSSASNECRQHDNGNDVNEQLLLWRRVTPPHKTQFSCSSPLIAASSSLIANRPVFKGSSVRTPIGLDLSQTLGQSRPGFSGSGGSFAHVCQVGLLGFSFRLSGIASVGVEQQRHSSCINTKSRWATSGSIFSYAACC